MKEHWLLVSLVALVALLGFFYSSLGVNIGGQASMQPSHTQAFPDCIDTDLGVYPSQAGSTYDKYGSYEDKMDDYCKDASTLVEYFCDQYGVNSAELPCEKGCEAGVCQ